MGSQEKKVEERRFRVVQVIGRPLFECSDQDHRLELALELCNQYGIHHIDLRRIVNIWSRFSRENSIDNSGWVKPDEFTVAKVFNVKLEERGSWE